MEEDIEYSDGEEINEKSQEKLVDNILSLSKVQKLKQASRTEPTLQISEFSLVKSLAGKKGSIHVSDLTKALNNKKNHTKIKSRIQNTVNKSKTLPKPLEKPQADRIRRGVAYEKTRLELDKWEPVVTSQRVSTNLYFPLNNNVNLDDAKDENYSSNWKLKSTIQEEMQKNMPEVEEYHIEEEEKKKFNMTVKELMEFRKEAAKLRAHQSYQEAKARRQKKIKSKKYHRIQRREKIKQQLKEFEILQKTNPEEALKKLDDIERTRAEERFSLRHRSTGQWAKNKQVRAKYDKESRQDLAQQLTLSKELTQKLKSTNSDSDEETAENEQDKNYNKRDTNNPWVNGKFQVDKEVGSFVSGYRKFWNEKSKNSSVTNDEDEETVLKNAESLKCKDSKEGVQKKKQKQHDINKLNTANHDVTVRSSCTTPKVNKVKQKKIQSKPDLNISSTSDWEVNESNDKNMNLNSLDFAFDVLEQKIENKLKIRYNKVKEKFNLDKKSVKKDKNSQRIEKERVNLLTLPDKSKKPKIDEELLENTGDRDKVAEDSNSLHTLKSILETKTDQTKSNIDPNKFIKINKVTTYMENQIPDILTTEDNEENVDQQDVIAEAFEDDDLIENFNKEKQDEINRDKVKDIDLSLPGWGAWGGTNIKISKRKKRRFVIKMPKKLPRKDDNKEKLIINEKAANRIRQHMVSEVPFPFKTIKDFEASVRAPIGNTFTTERAFRRLIRPAVRTRIGAIIEPITKDILLKRKDIE